MRFDFARASAYPKPFCTSVKISPIKLSTTIIASFETLQGADSLGTSAAYVVVAKMLTNVKIIIAFIPNIDSYIGLMHILFALEDMYSLKVNNIDGQVCITLDTENQSYLEMLKMISAWQKEYQKFIDGEITKEEYDQWRYTYPEKEGTGFKRIVQL